MWRLARPSDEDAIVEMSLALYREDPSPIAPGAEQVRRTLSVFRREPSRGRAIVLECDAQCAGYCLLVWFYSNEYGGNVCTIDELYVTTAARGQGQGTRLIEELIQGSDLLPPATVALALEVTPDNHRARALYERLGFSARNTLMRRRLAP